MVFALVTSGEYSVCRYLPELWVNTNSFAATKDNVSVSPAVMPDVLKSSILLHCYWWVLAASAAVWVSQLGM